LARYVEGLSNAKGRTASHGAAIAAPLGGGPGRNDGVDRHSTTPIAPTDGGYQASNLGRWPSGMGRVQVHEHVNAPP